MVDRREWLRRGAGACALASLGWPLAGRAQALAGNAAIVSGFPAGGMGDNVARPVAERLRGRYASSLTVESRTGAGGRIAVEYVKRAAPDGLAILQVPSSPMVLYPHTYRKLGYDPLADFAPVCSTVTYAFSFTAGPGLPLTYAQPLHEAFGQVVRVDGHCGCPSPLEWFKGFGVGLYHVDSPEGLKALARALTQCVEDAKA